MDKAHTSRIPEKTELIWAGVAPYLCVQTFRFGLLSHHS